MKRRNLFILVLILLLGVLFYVIAVFNGEPGANIVFQMQVNVPGWQDSGITVRPNKAITISAVGMCTWAEGSNEPLVGPDGFNYWIGNSSFLVPGLPAMSLVAKIDNGTPVFVGSGPVTLEGNGKLYLGFNDDIYTDNSGSLTATFYFENKPGN